jgi:hypothetical protein
MILCIVVLIAPVGSRAAQAQYIRDPRLLPFDFLEKGVDESLLHYHKARLENDIDQGDAIRANRDLNRIQMDE